MKPAVAIVLLTSGITFLLSPCQVQATPVQWSGNGHWYEAVAVGSSGITWTDAQAAAAARGGYLASITSDAENQFVFNLINSDAFWHNSGGGTAVGPWIGGYQPTGSPEPAGNWQWDSGESFGYNNWAAGQPNNSGGNENYIHFSPGSGSTRTATWNDLPNTPPSGWNVNGFVVETVPEPGTLSLLALTALGLLCWRRRMRIG